MLVLRRIICSAFFFLILLLSQTALAGVLASNTAPGINLPDSKPDATMVKPDASPSLAKLTQIRWAYHTDAVTGASSLRLVLDASGPVDVAAIISGTPAPHLVINVKNGVPGNIADSTPLDGRIADAVRVAAVDDQNSVITVDMPLMIDDCDYKVFTLPADLTVGKPFRVVVDINKPLPPPTFYFTAGLKNKVIVLDPGHGGTDPGAIGLGGTTEKSVNLPVALKVKALLEQAGAKVLMTRETDVDVFGPNDSAVDELNARASVANSHKVDLFLSIHANAAYSRTVGGTATYYYQKTRYDAILAQDIQASVEQSIGLADRGYFPG